MNGFIAWIKSDALLAKAIRTFVYSFVGVILVFWYVGTGPGDHRITGLVEAFKSQWDFAAGSGFLAALGTLGLTGLLQRPNP